MSTLSPVSLSKAPSVPASLSEGLVVLLDGFPANVQSVRHYVQGFVYVRFTDGQDFDVRVLPSGRALPLHADQTFPTGSAYL